jgi:DnaJ-class molecular chaperone
VELDSDRVLESVGGFCRLIELRIKQALAEGQFENLEGKGKPQDMNKDYEAPEHLRVSYHVFACADFLPEDVRLSKEIEQTKEKLARAQSEEEKFKLYKQLSEFTSKFNMAMECNRKFKRSLY